LQCAVLRFEEPALGALHDLVPYMKYWGWRSRQRGPPRELKPPPKPDSSCIAALLHGGKYQFFLYACVLGKRLQALDVEVDCVLLCGPGKFADRRYYRTCLEQCGWRLLRVDPIEASHLDRTPTKRHALVFTKLRVLELPYSKVLLLDLDILPRKGADVSKLLSVPAPAGKYHSSGMPDGPLPQHGEPIPDALCEQGRWCPNAGVMRLDPLRTKEERRHQVAEMVQWIQSKYDERQASFLPEQYFLAEYFSNWHMIDVHWNWEVFPERATPKRHSSETAAAEKARRESETWGWKVYYMASPSAPQTLNEAVDHAKANANVWHFCGMQDTQPWLFLDRMRENDVREFVQDTWYRHRDPGGIVAFAIAEWCEALQGMLDASPHPALVKAYARLRGLAKKLRSGHYPCEICRNYPNLLVHISPPASDQDGEDTFPDLTWVCGECYFERLLHGTRAGTQTL